MISALLFLYLLRPDSGLARQNETEAKEEEQAIKTWLLLGPFPMPLPAFHDDAQKEFSLKELIQMEGLDISKLKPRDNLSIKLHDGSSLSWKTIEADERGVELVRTSRHPMMAYLGVYVDVSRWTKAKVTLRSAQLFQVYQDGKSVVNKYTSEASEEENSSTQGKKTSGDLILENGKHLLLVKTLFDPESNSDWTIQASLSYSETYIDPAPALTLLPRERMTIRHLLDGPKVTDASISADGALAAISKSQTLPPSDDSESWLEIYDLSENCLMHTFRGDMSIANVNWAPQGKIFSYTSRNKEGSTIWIVDLEKGTSIPLLKNIKNLGRHTWAPDASFIIYSVTEKGKGDQEGVKRFQNLADRQPTWRDRRYLYKITIPDGVSQRLTAGELSASLQSISPDGKRLLFTRSIIDYSERPFSRTELFSLDLATHERKLLWSGKWFASAQWSPDGNEILILGGPSTFGDIGTNVPKKTIPNEYDTQAYLFDTATREVQSISRSFNPTINQAFWDRKEDFIYFLATDLSFRRLYIYDLKKKEFSFLDAGVEVIHQIDMAKKRPSAVYIGSSANSPPKAYFIDIANKKWQILHDPGKEDFTDVSFGEVKSWAFKNKRGHVIEGRVYYPPGFDKSKKYPCIVYYYGGTSPVTREFGGRYPKNLYAANGYLVYVMQPSGAVGFGQDFSALHVNDWGRIVADEIIDGVEKFLPAHPFVDSTSVGCIGASFGGFMTMSILTRTNMFSAAVAHAGISSISSYWGEGYWGYAYSAYATADSYPWNRKDIYINQSPLFNADKISTPLLLLHGAVDTNVPPGESTQLFTALKILGRQVEYIQILDQNHHIMTYNKRIIWTKTILAWFDRWLKKQPEWWGFLYPEK